MTSIKELETALLRADQAGDTEAATALAQALRQQLQQPVQTNLSPGQQVFADMSPLETFATMVGSGVHDVVSGLGFADKKTDYERSLIQAAKESDPIAAGLGEFTGQAAPGVALAVPLAAAAPTIGAAATTAGAVGLGGLEGYAIASGQGASEAEALASGVIGGATAGMLEVFGPRIVEKASELFKKVTGKTKYTATLKNGDITPEMTEELAKYNLTPQDVFDDALLETKDLDALTPQAAARRAALKEAGIDNPTRAQLTREADDFMEQEELAKRSSKVRNVLENQQATLTTRFDNKVMEAGKVSGESVPAVDAVVQKSTRLDNEIADLYNVARERSKDLPSVEMRSFSQLMKNIRGSDRKSEGNISAVLGHMKKMGLTTKTKSRKVDVLMAEPPRDIFNDLTVAQSEELRKFINSLYDETKPAGHFGNNLLRQMKDSIDDDVFKGAGADVFEKARAAKRNFENELDRFSIGKFDSRKTNIVRDVLENRVDPDKFIEQTLMSKKYRKEDIAQLANYVASESPEALDSFRADVLDSIKQRSFFGPEDQQGFQKISRDKFQKSIEKHGGWKKLGSVLNGNDIRFLKSMENALKIMEPVRGTAMGKGPTGAAMESVKDALFNQQSAQNSILLNIWGEIKSAKSGQLMISPTEKAVEGYKMGAMQSIPGSVAGGAFVSGEITEKD